MGRGETHAPTLVRRPFSFRSAHNSSVKKTPKPLAILTGFLPLTVPSAGHAAQTKPTTFDLIATSISDRLFAATL